MSTVTEPAWRKEPAQPLWKSLLAFLLGLGLLWLAWYSGFPWWVGAIVGLLVLERMITRAWHKTIRPAIIELIREALR